MRETYTCCFYRYQLLRDGSCRVIDCRLPAKELNVPEMLDGHPVVAIHNRAFFHVRDVVECITLPKTIRYVESRAFEGCLRLKEVRNLDCACYVSHTALLASGALSVFQIPKGTTHIDRHIFMNCERLVSVTIPNSVTSIDSGAFAGCCQLKNFEISEQNPCYCAEGPMLLSKDGSLIAFPSAEGCITLPQGIRDIRPSAFAGCKNLVSITLPDSVTSIGRRAFEWCTRLASITLPDSVTSIGEYAFEKCTSLTSITLPDSVTSIGDCAFSVCTGLTSIVIPDSVTSIGSGAFEWCIGLTSITLPGSVTSIGSGAFKQCNGLTSITIPDSVTSIGCQAFEWCISLTSITIPDSVIYLGCNPFHVCTHLASITLPAHLNTSKLVLPETCQIHFHK